MKKLIVCMFVLLLATSAYGGTSISVLPFITPDDVTISHLETQRSTFQNFLNSIDGDNIQSGTITPDQLNANASPVTRWQECFNDFVYTGLTIPTSASLASTTTLGTAYINGERVVKEATAHTYTASKWTYVTLNSVGTYVYDEKAIDGTPDSLGATSVRVARVSTDPTTIPHVLDMRILAISLDNTQEDFQRSGLEMTVTPPDAISIAPGVIYHGTVRIKKLTATTLNLGAAGDWATGGGARGTSDKGYVVIDSTGTIKLSTTDPTLHDTASTTAGDLRYSVIGSAKWRVLSQFWMNASGSGNIEDFGYTDWPDNLKRGEVVQVARYQNGNMTTGTTAIPHDDTIPQITEGDEYMTLDFTPTTVGNMLKVDVVTHMYNTNAGTLQVAALFQDATASALACGFVYCNGENVQIQFTHYVTADTAINRTFRVRGGGNNGATTTFNGLNGAAKYGGTLSSSLTVTEIKQ